MNTTPIIRLEHVDRTFQVGDQQVHALSDVTLDIAQGDYLSLMGPSGSGKSTLLHIIGLLDRPSAGHYLLEGKETTHYSDNEQARLRREHIGFVFQFFHLVPRLTAAQNIELPLMLAGMPAEERMARVGQVLQAFDIAERAHHRPDQLSGGQRQRVAIGRAMVSEPKVLLADEPTGNLDRASGHEVLTLLEALNAKGITLIIVTHDPELGQRARRQLHMVDGRIVADTAVPQ